MSTPESSSSSFASAMRFRWPTVVLAVSIGLTCVGIIEAMRASRGQPPHVAAHPGSA